MQNVFYFATKQQFNIKVEKKTLFSDMLFKNALLLVTHSEGRKSNRISIFSV